MWWSMRTSMTITRRSTSGLLTMVAKPGMAPGLCLHRWRIGEQGQPQSEGVCSLCGERRMYWNAYNLDRGEVDFGDRKRKRNMIKRAGLANLGRGR